MCSSLVVISLVWPSPLASTGNDMFTLAWSGVTAAAGRLLSGLGWSMTQEIDATDESRRDGGSDEAVDGLVREALDGDEAAFARLITLCKQRVVRLASRFARNTADLDELAQDVFIHVHRSLHRFRGDAPFEHWVCRIATRRCQDYLRRIYRRRWWTSLDAMRESGFDPAAEREPTDPRVEWLRRALHRLHPDHQTVLNLLEIEQLPVREIAALTGWSESNVKVRAFRARAALRQQMEKLKPAG